MSVRRFQDCPTCGAELAMRQKFLPTCPDDQFVWWDRCTNCGGLLIQPSQALIDRDDGPQMVSEFAAAIREYERDAARAYAASVNHPRPCGIAPTDNQHRCINCAYVCRKGRGHAGGMQMALWCGYRNEFIVDYRGQRILNPTDADCPDWFPFEQEGQRCR